MKLYVVRHGQTDWNLKDLAQGRADIPLNARGIKQAEELKEKIRDLKFDICYSSPLLRAKETAEIIVGDKCKIIYDDNLREKDFGNLEGTDSKTWEEDDYDLRLNSSYGGMEPILDVFKRSKKALERIKTENPEDARVLVVAHGTFLKTLHFNIVGYNLDTDITTFKLENGEIREYEI
ncbi:histidine phosphatase family protein [Candidatus Saccharibacteria bacterium]|nr:histidine phosphatase family protein [Candidatus Saccharibacteria bacterium]